MINLPNTNHIKRLDIREGAFRACPPKKSIVCTEPFRVKDAACLPLNRIAEQQVCKLKERDSKEDDEGQDDPKCREHTDEMPFLKEMIDSLAKSSGEAYEDAATRLGGFYNYLANAFSEQQLYRMIETNGGSIVEQNEDFFVIRDSNNNQYIIERNVPPLLNDAGYF